MNSLDEEFQIQELEDLQRNPLSEEELDDAKNILASSINELPPVELKNTITDIHFLAECMVDDFEREIFDGKTLHQILEEDT